MPYVPDINTGALFNDSTDDRLDSVVRQINEWGRIISNEKRTEIYKDNAGDNRIIIGVLPDNTTGIVISESGTDVLSLF